MCSWHFTIRERDLIHSLCILVTEFKSSAIIPAIIHIQNMALLIGQAWTERCSAVFFSVSVEAHSEQEEDVLVHCSWVCIYVGAKLEDCGDLVHHEDILVFHLSFHTHLLLRWYHCLTCSQAAICNKQMCCLINIVTCCLRCLT